MINDKADEAIKKSFKSLLHRYQNNLEKLVKCNEFVFDYVQMLYCKCHKLNSSYRGSYLDSPNWIKNKIVTINPNNEMKLLKSLLNHSFIDIKIIWKSW